MRAKAVMEPPPAVYSWKQDPLSLFAPECMKATIIVMPSPFSLKAKLA
jgi:hypothetical protein